MTTRKTPVAERLNVASNTADVLSRPSQMDYELATKAIEQVDLDVICRDLGAVTAREYANVLDNYALKPSDYAAMDALHEKLAGKLVQHLKSSESFVRAFQAQLKMRG
jgi:hypothetical protein